MKAVKRGIFLTALLLCAALLAWWAATPVIIRRSLENSPFFRWCQTISSKNMEGACLSDPSDQKLFPFPENFVLSQEEEAQLAEILSGITLEDLELLRDPVRKPSVFHLYVIAGGRRYLFECYDVTEPVFGLTPETPEEAEALSVGPFRHLTVYAPELLDFAAQRFS